MIKIKYYSAGTTGEFTLDPVKFIENHTLEDVKFLCKKIIGISYDRFYVSKEIIKICEDQLIEEKRKLKEMEEWGDIKKNINKQIRLIRKYEKAIRLLNY